MEENREKAFDIQDPNWENKKSICKIHTICVSCRTSLDSPSHRRKSLEALLSILTISGLMPDLYTYLEEPEVDKRQADHAGTQNDPTNHSNVSHDYSLHSRMVCRLK